MRERVPTMSTYEARKRFSVLVSRAAFGRERIALTRYGRMLAAVVPINDLARLVKQDAPVQPPINSPKDMVEALRRELATPEPRAEPFGEPRW
jgi:antitoxin (DNA-binding transcriptional repressor) of toxin-antitoxin stability system